MAVKVAINGFGRIGRSVARIIEARDDIELVAINDTATPEVLEYLTRYDSVHGNFTKEVKYVDGYLHMGKIKAKVFNDRDPKNLDFAACGAEIVLECTGVFLSKDNTTLVHD